MTEKILVYWNITEGQRQQIKETAERFGFQAVFTVDPDEAVREAADSEILFGKDVKPLEAAAHLKWFCSQSAGINSYLVPGVLPNEECLLSNSSGAYGVTIAEHIIMVTLMLMRNFNEYDAILHTRKWTHSLPMQSLHSSRITGWGPGISAPRLPAAPEHLNRQRSLA